MFDHASGEYLSVDDADIYYELKGEPEKPVLLFLHGGFGTIDTFNGVLPAVSDHYHILGIDSRGHGKSTLGSAPLTYERLEGDVERVLVHLGIRTLSIVGFSDGGIAAYRLASSGKFQVERLLTIGSEWSTQHAKEKFPLYQKITGASWRGKFPQDFDIYERLNPAPNFDLFAHKLVQMWSDAAASGYPNDTVDAIACPVLAVRGENDFLVSRDSVIELSERLESIQPLEIPSAGHEAHREQQAVFLEELRAFL